MPILIKSATKEPPVWRGRLIACGMFLISTMLLFYTARDLEQEYRLYQHGIYTEGTALRWARDKSGYDVYYKFNYNGVTYQAVSDAKESWLNSAKFPTTIRVHFLSRDPNISRLPDVRNYFYLWFNIGFCCFLCLAAFALGVTVIRECYEILKSRKAKRKGAQPWHLPAYPKAWH